MVFSKFFTQSVRLGGIRGHKPPEGGVLQHFQQVITSNIGNTELDLGRSFDLISLKRGTTVISIEDWGCIVFGPIRPNEGGC